MFDQFEKVFTLDRVALAAKRAFFGGLRRLSCCSRSCHRSWSAPWSLRRRSRADDAGIESTSAQVSGGPAATSLLTRTSLASPNRPSRGASLGEQVREAHARAAEWCSLISSARQSSASGLMGVKSRWAIVTPPHVRARTPRRPRRATPPLHRARTSRRAGFSAASRLGVAALAGSTGHRWRTRMVRRPRSSGRIRVRCARRSRPGALSTGERKTIRFSMAARCCNGRSLR